MPKGVREKAASTSAVSPVILRVRAQYTWQIRIPDTEWQKIVRIEIENE